MSTIGTAYIQIEPTTSGIGGTISKALNAEASTAGTAAGGKLSSALGSAAKVGGIAIAGLTTAITGASAALVSAASGTAEYGDNIDKMSQKLGVSAEFYQEWDAVLQHSGTSMDSMKTSFKTLSKAVQDGSSDQQDAFAALGLSMESMQGMSTEDAFATVIGQLQQMEEGTERTTIASALLGKGAVELGALLNTSAEDTQKMIDDVHDLGGVMSDEAVKASAQFQDSLQNLQTAFAGVKNSAMANLLPAFSEIMDGFSDLVSSGEDSEGKITSGMQKLADGISAALPKAVSALSQITQSILAVAPEIISTLAQGIIDALPELIPVLAEVVIQIATSLIEFLPQLIEAGAQVIIEIALGIAEALPELIPTIVNVVLTIIETLTDNVDMLVDAAIALMTGLADGIINALPVLIEKSPEIIIKLVEAIIENLPKLIEASIQIVIALVQGIVQSLPKMAEAAGQIMMSIITEIGNKLAPLGQAASKIITTIKDAIVSRINMVVNSIETMIANVKKAFEDKISEFVNIGRQMVEGIKKGFADAWDSVKEWLKGMIGNIIDWAKEILGIHSPSRVFADEVGHWIPAGIAAGIENNLGVVHDAMKSVSSELLDEGLNARATFDAAVSTSSGLYQAEVADYNLNKQNEIIDMLKSYLPQLAQGNNVNVTLEGDAKGIFRAVRNENTKMIKATGYHALA